MEDRNIRVVELYRSGRSLSEVATIVGLKSPVSIRNILLKYNEPIRSKAGFSNMDLVHDYFETIDTERKAYFLGFLLADGSVSERENSQPVIRMEINKDDKYILGAIKEDIKPDSSVLYTNKNCVALRWHSLKMFNDLNRYSIFPNKTGGKFFPKDQIPKLLMNHFIRGFLDGNGWITNRSAHYGKNIYKNIGFSDGLRVLTELRDYLTETLNLYKVSVIPHGGTYMIIYGSKEDVDSLVTYLYSDATIYLTRKYEKAMLSIR